MPQPTSQITIEEATPIEVEEPNFTIPPENEIVTNPKVMLSTEIAALTGKNHQHVMRDIRVIVEQLQKDSPNLDSGFKSSTYLAGNGKQEKCYELDYEATMIVLTGYDVVARAKVIKHWQDLEQKVINKQIEPVTKPVLSLSEFSNNSKMHASWHLIAISKRFYFRNSRTRG